MSARWLTWCLSATAHTERFHTDNFSCLQLEFGSSTLYASLPVSETLLLVYEPLHSWCLASVLWVSFSLRLFFSFMLSLLFAVVIRCLLSKPPTVAVWVGFWFLTKRHSHFYFRISSLSCFFFPLSRFYPKCFRTILQKLFSFIISCAFLFADFSFLYAMQLLYLSIFFIF